MVFSNWVLMYMSIVTKIALPYIVLVIDIKKVVLSGILLKEDYIQPNRRLL